jgi:hypothetical protein
MNGKRQKDATVVDAYQNCFVRRTPHDRNRLESDGPVPPPRAGLRLTDLTDD